MLTVKDMSNSHYTKEEILEKIKGLSRLDIIKIQKAYSALGCEKRIGLTGQDVFQHVILMALEAVGRPWPIGVNAVAYMMQSGKSHIYNQSQRKLKLHYIPEVDDLLTEKCNSTDLIFPTSMPYCDSSLQNVDELTFFNMWMDKIKALFKNDEDAICFIENKIESKKKSIILNSCNFSDQEYRNIEKRIKDKVRKRFPNGLQFQE